MNFIKNIFEEDEEGGAKWLAYQNLCKTVGRLGIVHGIYLDTEGDEVTSDCMCCSYFHVSIIHIRVVVSMKRKHEMKEWYDYDVML